MKRYEGNDQVGLQISWSQLVEFVIFWMCKWVYCPKKRKSRVELLKKLPLRFGQALINSWQLMNIGVNLSIITHWLLLFISTLSLGILWSCRGLLLKWSTIMLSDSSVKKYKILKHVISHLFKLLIMQILTQSRDLCKIQGQLILHLF